MTRKQTWTSLWKLNRLQSTLCCSTKQRSLLPKRILSTTTKRRKKAVVAKLTKTLSCLRLESERRLRIQLSRALGPNSQTARAQVWIVQCSVLSTEGPLSKTQEEELRANHLLDKTLATNHPMMLSHPLKEASRAWYLPNRRLGEKETLLNEKSMLLVTTRSCPLKKRDPLLVTTAASTWTLKKLQHGWLTTTITSVSTFHNVSESAKAAPPKEQELLSFSAACSPLWNLIRRIQRRPKAIWRLPLSVTIKAVSSSIDRVIWFRIKNLNPNRSLRLCPTLSFCKKNVTWRTWTLDASFSLTKRNSLLASGASPRSTWLTERSLMLSIVLSRVAQRLLPSRTSAFSFCHSSTVFHSRSLLSWARLAWSWLTWGACKPLRSPHGSSRERPTTRTKWKCSSRMSLAIRKRALICFFWSSMAAIHSSDDSSSHLTSFRPWNSLAKTD